jgi:hypothetical protein
VLTVQKLKRFDWVLHFVDHHVQKPLLVLQFLREALVVRTQIGYLYAHGCGEALMHSKLLSFAVLSDWQVFVIAFLLERLKVLV